MHSRLRGSRLEALALVFAFTAHAGCGSSGGNVGQVHPDGGSDGGAEGSADGRPLGAGDSGAGVPDGTAESGSSSDGGLSDGSGE
jgi:hypothetical protein